MSYIEINAEQRRIYIDVIQTYQALEEARLQARHYAGYMTWKKAKGREYLFKGRAGVRGVGQSLGLRTAETQAQYDAFYTGKEAAVDRVKSLEQQVELKSKYALANRLGRVPKEATEICRALNQAECKYTVVGSNALYGYEALAGIMFSTAVIATEDLDILLDTRERLKISVDDYSPRFIDILRKADRSFLISDQQPFRAINNKGYMVDLITPPKKPRHSPNEFAETLLDDLDIAEIEKLEWLVNAPHIDSFPIGYDGIPVRLRVPDPRAFTMHKYFVSRQADREPVKKKRDDLQARLMLRIVRDYLTSYPFSDGALRNFPAKLRKEFLEAGSNSQEERLW